MSNKGFSIYLDKYSKYVIRNLIDIKGKSQSDVANFIIKDWIGDHQAELKEYGINVENARKEGIFKKSESS